MPTRIVRDGILTSERIAKLDWAQEVFYRRLMSVADDYGRFYALPALIRAACYPLLVDKVKDANISAWLTACVDAGLLHVYVAADAKRYLEIIGFGQRIQSKSKFPEPSAESSEAQPSTVAHGEVPGKTAVVVVGDGVEGGVEGEPARKRAAGAQRRSMNLTDMPSDFGISDRVRQWAKRKGYEHRLEDHLEAFRCKATAKGYRYADWDSALMEAVREDWANLRNGARHPVAGGDPQPSPASQRRLG